MIKKGYNQVKYENFRSKSQIFLTIGVQKNKIIVYVKIGVLN